MRQRAGLNGDPIGEPRICSKTVDPIDNWAISRDMQGHANDRFDVPSDDLASDIQCAACSAFADVPDLIAPRRFHRQNLIGPGAHI